MVIVSSRWRLLCALQRVERLLNVFLGTIKPLALSHSLYSSVAATFTLNLNNDDAKPHQALREDFSSFGLEPTVVSVAAADLRLAGDHRAWDISWASTPGNTMASYNFSCTGLNLTTAYTGDGVCSARLVAESAGSNSPMKGTFAITVTNAHEVVEQETTWGFSQATVHLAYNATAGEVQAALEAQDGVGAVEVDLSRSLPGGGGGGGAYLITFTGAAAPVGGIYLEVSAGGLNGTRAGAAVREVYPGSRWGGEFALSLGGLEGAALAFDADAEEVRAAIEALTIASGSQTGRVDVLREEVEAGFRWAVAFSEGDLDCDLDLMEVSASGYGYVPTTGWTGDAIIIGEDIPMLTNDVVDLMPVFLGGYSENCREYLHTHSSPSCKDNCSMLYDLNCAHH